ncbi:MAG: nucleoside-diphosphate kinase [Actinomycetota bacterium]|nr:nucleoside-diphosphate kinase [Actinomycetota bacterium]
MERTFTMIKPDGVKKALVGEIVKRYQDAGLKLVALKLTRLSRDKAEELYSVHQGKPFYMELVDFITSGPVAPMVVEGDNAVSRVREIMGATNPQEADKGTIRGDFAEEVSENIVHGADSVESANREIPIFFNDDELVG